MSYRGGQERSASRRDLPSDLSDDELIVDSIGEPDDIYEADEPESHTGASAVASAGTPASGFGAPLNQASARAFDSSWTFFFCVCVCVISVVSCWLQLYEG